MHGKNLALIKEIPTRCTFSRRQAAKYLGIGDKLLIELSDTGALKCYDFRGRRTYKLEDLDRFIESLEEWKPHTMKNGV